MNEKSKNLFVPDPNGKISRDEIFDSLSDEIALGREKMRKALSSCVDPKDLWGINNSVPSYTTSETVSKHACAYRRARYPNGRIVLQAGYNVTQGFMGPANSSYIKWVTMETIDVDEDGLTSEDRHNMLKAKASSKG